MPKWEKVYKSYNEELDYVNKTAKTKKRPEDVNLLILVYVNVL